MYVTPQAQAQLDPLHIWYHLGGASDEGDTYDTQEYYFKEQLAEFWAQLHGPDEVLRRQFAECTLGLKMNWKSITIFVNGQVTIRYKNGKEKTIVPPATNDKESKS